MDSTERQYPVRHTDAHWRKQLTPQEFAVLRTGATEKPFTGEYTDDHTEASYHCRACDAELFRSTEKFDSHCGWPSFFAPGSSGAVEYRTDTSAGMTRTEVRCATCGSHLGHVFEGEGYDTPTDQRYCINSISLRQHPQTRAGLRPITPDDYAFVLQLNHDNVELLAPLAQPRLEQLINWADHADTITYDDAPAGFVITLASSAPYDSPNFEWFQQRYPQGFIYFDRIVIADEYRRHGLGSATYDALERAAAPHGRVALEANLDPPNEPSLAFHRDRGYVEVGTRTSEYGTVLSMMVKEL